MSKHKWFKLYDAHETQLKELQQEREQETKKINSCATELTRVMNSLIKDIDDNKKNERTT